MKSMLLKKNKTSSDELFISLAESAGQPVHWYHQPSHGDTQQGELVDETVLHELLPLATTSQITLLIPTKNVLLKTVTFSGKYRHQNRRYWHGNWSHFARAMWNNCISRC